MMKTRAKSMPLAAVMLLCSAAALTAAGETDLLKAVKARDLIAIHALIEQAC